MIGHPDTLPFHPPQSLPLIGPPAAGLISPRATQNARTVRLPLAFHFFGLISVSLPYRTLTVPDLLFQVCFSRVLFSRLFICCCFFFFLSLFLLIPRSALA